MTVAELAVLDELGPVGLRCSRARRRLHHSADARHRRASAHAAGMVLQHCAETGRVYWCWTSADWARLRGSSAEAFRAARVTPTETTVRPFLGRDRLPGRRLR